MDGLRARAINLFKKEIIKRLIEKQTNLFIAGNYSEATVPLTAAETLQLHKTDFCAGWLTI